MEKMDNQFIEIDLMKLCFEHGILKMKTNFSFGNINQNFSKDCIHCPNNKQKVYVFKNGGKKIKNMENIIFNKTKKKATNIIQNL